jgi:hypothetical protein
MVVPLFVALPDLHLRAGQRLALQVAHDAFDPGGLAAAVIQVAVAQQVGVRVGGDAHRVERTFGLCRGGPPADRGLGTHAGPAEGQGNQRGCGAAAGEVGHGELRCVNPSDAVRRGEFR